ncbi:MAG: hypothetical protein WCP97_01150 [bacterium]
MLDSLKSVRVALSIVLVVAFGGLTFLSGYFVGSLKTNTRLARLEHEMSALTQDKDKPLLRRPAFENGSMKLFRDEIEKNGGVGIVGGIVEREESSDENSSLVLLVFTPQGPVRVIVGADTKIDNHGVVAGVESLIVGKEVGVVGDPVAKQNGVLTAKLITLMDKMKQPTVEGFTPRGRDTPAQ